MNQAVLKSTQETSANFGEQEKKVTHVSDQEHKKRHIQHIQREIQSLKEMKEEEKQEGRSR